MITSALITKTHHDSVRFIDTPKHTNFEWNPLVDIYEDSSGFQVLMEMPGIDLTDISVEAAPKSLIVKGIKKFSAAIPDGTRSRQERAFGSFKREIAFPTEIRSDAIQTKIHNGLLTVSLPKVNHSAPQSVRITFEN
jgi:HSP20 family protein